MELAEIAAHSPWPLLLGGVVTALAILFRRRNWEQLSDRWRLVIGLGAPLTGLVIGGLTWLLNGGWPLAYALGSLSTVTLIALYTDLKWRMVRSDIFWIFTGFALPYWFLIPKYLLVPFVAMIGAGLAAMLLPFFGQSDSRAFILGVAVSFPASEALGTIYALMTAAIIVLLLALGLIVARGSRGESISDLKSVSLAAVPLITVSFMVGTVLAVF